MPLTGESIALHIVLACHVAVYETLYGASEKLVREPVSNAMDFLRTVSTATAGATTLRRVREIRVDEKRSFEQK